MKTACREQYGPPQVLSVREVPVPEPRQDEMLVRVRAATVSRTDSAGLLGEPYIYRFFVGWPRPRHVATGCDFAGEIEAIGANCAGFQVGQRVWGFDDNSLGTHAQYLTIRGDQPVALIPDGVSYQDAAASAEGAHYALNFMKKIELLRGQRILVIGGTGAIGSAAIPLLHHRGLRVTAVAPGPYLDTVRERGAERVIDYLTEDFATVLAKEEPFDFVFDAVGKSSFGTCKRLLKNHGAYLSSELGPRGENIPLSLFAPVLSPFSRGKKVVFPLPVDVRGSLSQMAKLLAEGTFRPLIDRSFPIEQVAEAFAYVLTGQKIGNVLLTMD